MKVDGYSGYAREGRTSITKLSKCGEEQLTGKGSKPLIRYDKTLFRSITVIIVVINSYIRVSITLIFNSLSFKIPKLDK